MDMPFAAKQSMQAGALKEWKEHMHMGGAED